ncbi:pyridoxal 5'-phosphate synthase glutaminase subunit PdxT [Spirochaetia bacterium 38H-sp]|uniref:Pyridoxal 5'-phosphate synthase subunit PdxT n=1 Tax=Rarispira pelagica TaxID=3141764 RepID=A0ABU9UCT9_9SPIR
MAATGILGLQGDYALHLAMLEKLGAEGKIVRTLEEINSCSALIIPGGESTTMLRLLKRFNMLDGLKKLIKEGMPVFGTCAGAILLASKISNYPGQTHLDALDITVERNAYGRQVESFEADIEADLGNMGRHTIRAVFIRAPKITETQEGVESLAFFENTPVLVKKGPVLAATFHPELTDDTSIHKYFLQEVAGLL